MILTSITEAFCALFALVRVTALAIFMLQLKGTFLMPKNRGTDGWVSWVMRHYWRLNAPSRIGILKHHSFLMGTWVQFWIKWSHGKVTRKKMPSLYDIISCNGTILSACVWNVWRVIFELRWTEVQNFFPGVEMYKIEGTAIHCYQFTQLCLCYIFHVILKMQSLPNYPSISVTCRGRFGAGEPCSNTENPPVTFICSRAFSSQGIDPMSPSDFLNRP